MRSPRNVLALSLSIISVFFVSSASAQEQPEPAGAHTHDGFYLRLGLGLGYLSDSQSVNGNDFQKIKGMGSAYVLSIGGTPVPGLVIAGTSFVHFQPKPSVEVGGVTGDSNTAVFLWSIGPTVDFFPDPHGGLHFGGGPMYGTYNATNYTSTGFAVTAWGGYDFWIGKNWSFGPSLQLTYNHSSKDQTTDSATSAAIMLTFLDH